MELEENKKIDAVLRNAGFNTFLPQRDGFLYADLVKQLTKQNCSYKKAEEIALNLIVYLDIYEVCEDCDATVLNMNGRVPDEGAVSEAALCFRSEKPIVIYKQDTRSLLMGKDNPLVVGLTEFEIVNKIEDIPLKLRELENLTESAYSRMIKTAGNLFKEYNQKDIELLAKLGKKYFLKNK